MKKIDRHTNVLVVPGGLLFLRTVQIGAAVSTHMVHVPCSDERAAAFVRGLRDAE